MEADDIDVLIQNFNNLPDNIFENTLPIVQEPDERQKLLMSDLYDIAMSLYTSQQKFNNIIESYDSENLQYIKEKISQLFHKIDQLEYKIDYLTKLIVRK